MNSIEKILEIQRVWQNLSDDDEPTVSLAAHEGLSKCAESITVLRENLRKIGYLWVYQEKIPVEEIERNIQIFETRTGSSLPKVLVEFWKLVGGVSFVDLENYQHVDFWKENGISGKSGITDGLHVDPCIEEWTSSVCDDFDYWKESFMPDKPSRFLLGLSPDGYHKDGFSGGSPYGIFMESTWKPIWRNFEWSGLIEPLTALAYPPDFISYLRTTILECAGFPGLLGVPSFEAIKGKLLDGVRIF